MSDSSNSPSGHPSEAVAPFAPQTPRQILEALLADNGFTSTQKLKGKLREHGHTDVDKVIDELSKETAVWRKHMRSFYTLEKYAAMKAADTSNPSEEDGSDDDEDDIEVRSSDLQVGREAHPPGIIKVARESRRQNRESKLCNNYLHAFLKSLYHSDKKPEDCDNVFVVQDQRPSSDFRNVDLIAVHWRTETVVELVTVEAKLHFTSQLVQQAANYTRFSHRVWIAVVVDAGVEVEELAAELREKDPLLFEYVLSLGLGIVACQKGRGGSFNCYAIQWPRRQNPEQFETITFQEDYRETFEQAGVLETRKRKARVA